VGRLRAALRSGASLAAAILPDVIGLAGIGAVVVGVYGLWGRDVALIAAGAPVAAAYVARELAPARKRRG
jgi:hypothetical protein